MKLKIIIIMLLLMTTIILSGCSNENIDCEKLDETQCLEHQDICSLCPEKVISSYASCHSIEFCQNIPLE